MTDHCQSNAQEQQEKFLLIDGHADILYRMDREHLDFYEDCDTLHLNYKRLCQADIDLQVFVLFPDDRLTDGEQLRAVLGMIDMFYQRVCVGGKMRPVLSTVDLNKNLELGLRSGLLSIEGGGCLQGDLRQLRIMYQLGVRAMGLTWNTGNCIADGVGEPQDRGLTPFGREVVREMNRLGMVVDVSHLAPKGFWGVVEESTAPFIASHSNAKAIHNHRRNLDDNQIRAIIEAGGTVGLTYVPYFVSDKEQVTIQDLLRHVDHILALGGENHLALGSDFDGIETTMVDLRHGGDYPRLQEALVKAYGDTVTRKIMGENFKRVLLDVLKD
ncbi:MAG TPA: dipeptidase [Bacilli bacterium]|nr:dipeptidase [Bacilli bacterium]